MLKLSKTGQNLHCQAFGSASLGRGSETVYGHLQQSHLQQPSFCGPPKFRSFASKPFAARIGHLQQK